MSAMSSIDTIEPAAERGPRHAFPGIEGLRGIAAVGVMFAHVILIGGALSFPRIVNHAVFLGLNGVTLFFCLSGFLLYAPFVRSVFGESRPETRAFYIRRLLRIYPAYLVIAVSAWIAGAWVIRPPQVGGGSLGPIGRPHDAWSILGNLTLLQGYSPSTVLSGLSVSWSLVPELIFYALLPVLGGLAYLLRRQGMGAGLAAAIPAGIMIVGGLIVRLLAVHLITHGGGGADGLVFRQDGASWIAVLRTSFPGSADLFGLGMLGAVLVTLAETRTTARRTVMRASAVVAGFGLIAVLIVQNANVSAPMIGTFAAAAIILIALRSSWLPVRALTALLRTRAADYLGRISYSIYLWHFPILLFVVVHSGKVTTYGGFAVRMVEIVGATLVLSSLSYRFVELPAQRLARRLSARRRATVAA